MPRNKPTQIIHILSGLNREKNTEVVDAFRKALSRAASYSSSNASYIIGQLSENIENADPQVRRCAIESLGRVVGPDQTLSIMPMLREAVNGQAWSVSKAAIEALKSVIHVDRDQGPNIIRILKTAAENGTQDWKVRETAIEAFASVLYLAPPRALDIIRLFKEVATPGQALDVSIAGIKALGQITLFPEKSNDIISILQTATQDEDFKVRRAGIEALAQVARYDFSNIPKIITILDKAVPNEDDNNEEHTNRIAG